MRKLTGQRLCKSASNTSWATLMHPQVLLIGRRLDARSAGGRDKLDGLFKFGTAVNGWGHPGLCLQCRGLGGTSKKFFVEVHETHAYPVSMGKTFITEGAEYTGWGPEDFGAQISIQAVRIPSRFAARLFSPEQGLGINRPGDFELGHLL